jgi:hypothetical protein
MIANFVIDDSRFGVGVRETNGRQQLGGRLPPRRPRRARRRPQRPSRASAALTWKAWLFVAGYFAMAIGLGVATAAEINEDPELYIALSSAQALAVHW